MGIYCSEKNLTYLEKNEIQSYIKLQDHEKWKTRVYKEEYDAEKKPDRSKVMKINERWEKLKEESNANIQSEACIMKRQTRSIQTEDTLGT